MSQFKKGDRVFVEAVVINEEPDVDGDILTEMMESGKPREFFVDANSVHANHPGKPDSSPVDNALFAWRAWMKEAIMYEHEGESAAGCVDIAREIREGAAVGFVLDCAEVES